MKTKSALPWFGSDASVAKSLAAYFDGCSHVTIPFCGGMSILPHLKARAVVANDLHNAAITFYRVASGAYGENGQQRLFELCDHTLSHPNELERARAVTLAAGAVLRAWAFWTECWVGRKGKGGTRSQGGMPSVRRTAIGGSNSSRISSAAADLPVWASHFKRCEWQQICFRELLPKVADDKTCGLYSDSPWEGAGRNYLHRFGVGDHQELEQLLRRFERTTVLVRYGDHPLIRELYSDEHWKITEGKSRTQANRNIGELWITNCFFNPETIGGNENPKV